MTYTRISRRLIGLVLVVLLAATAHAQSVVSAIGQLDATAVAALRGNTTVVVQVQGTWAGTLTFEGSLDGSTYTAINVTALNATSGVSTTTANGMWSGSVSGVNFVRVRFSSYTSGSAVVGLQTFYVSASGGGSGGGSASSVTINDPTTTTQKVSVNASGQMSITCANCSGSGASAVDQSTFTVGSTSGAPAMGIFEASPTTVTDGKTGAFGMTTTRSLKIDLSGSAANTNAFKVNVASGGVASGAIASGAVASGAIASGAIASGACASGCFAAGALADGADVTQGAKGDAKSTATDTTAISAISILKEISFMEQNPATQAVTAASLPLPALASTSTKQSDGSQKTQIVDGSGNVIASTSNNLNVQCANCSGSGASAADEASFTAGASTFAPSGGFFQTTATSNALTNGQQGMWQFTAQRAGFVNLRTAAGVELTNTSNALDVNIKSGGSTTVTEAATITANQSNSALTAAVLFGFDGTTDAKLRTRAGLVNSADVGLVTRPFTASDGTNTAPTGDAMARALYARTAPWADGTLASGAVTSAMTGTTSTSVVGATASNYIYITQCTVSNASTTVSTDILLQDGSGGTTLYVLPDPAAAVATTGGGGGTFSFPVPLKVPTIGGALFAANVTTGSSTKISCSGFKSTTSF